MKHGKNPTRKQKQKLQRLKFDPRMWLVVEDSPVFFVVEHRVSGEVRRLVRRAGT